MVDRRPPHLRWAQLRAIVRQSKSGRLRFYRGLDLGSRSLREHHGSRFYCGSVPVGQWTQRRGAGTSKNATGGTAVRRHPRRAAGVAAGTFASSHRTGRAGAVDRKNMNRKERNRRAHPTRPSTGAVALRRRPHPHPRRTAGHPATPRARARAAAADRGTRRCRRDCRRRSSAVETRPPARRPRAPSPPAPPSRHAAARCDAPRRLPCPPRRAPRSGRQRRRPPVREPPAAGGGAPRAARVVALTAGGQRRRPPPPDDTAAASAAAAGAPCRGPTALREKIAGYAAFLAPGCREKPDPVALKSISVGNRGRSTDPAACRSGPNSKHHSKPPERAPTIAACQKIQDLGRSVARRAMHVRRSSTPQCVAQIAGAWAAFSPPDAHS